MCHHGQGHYLTMTSSTCLNNTVTRHGYLANHIECYLTRYLHVTCHVTWQVSHWVPVHPYGMAVAEANVATEKAAAGQGAWMGGATAVGGEAATERVGAEAGTTAGAEVDVQFNADGNMGVRGGAAVARGNMGDWGCNSNGDEGGDDGDADGTKLGAWGQVATVPTCTWKVVVLMHALTGVHELTLVCHLPSLEAGESDADLFKVHKCRPLTQEGVEPVQPVVMWEVPAIRDRQVWAAPRNGHMGLMWVPPHMCLDVSVVWGHVGDVRVAVIADCGSLVAQWAMGQSLQISALMEEGRQSPSPSCEATQEYPHEVLHKDAPADMRWVEESLQTIGTPPQLNRAGFATEDDEGKEGGDTGRWAVVLDPAPREATHGGQPMEEGPLSLRVCNVAVAPVRRPGSVRRPASGQTTLWGILERCPSGEGATAVGRGYAVACETAASQHLQVETEAAVAKTRADEEAAVAVVAGEKAASKGSTVAQRKAGEEEERQATDQQREGEERQAAKQDASKVPTLAVLQANVDQRDAHTATCDALHRERAMYSDNASLDVNFLLSEERRIHKWKCIMEEPSRCDREVDSSLANLRGECRGMLCCAVDLCVVESDPHVRRLATQHAGDLRQQTLAICCELGEWALGVAKSQHQGGTVDPQLATAVAGELRHVWETKRELDAMAATAKERWDQIGERVRVEDAAAALAGQTQVPRQVPSAEQPRLHAGRGNTAAAAVGQKGKACVSHPITAKGLPIQPYPTLFHSISDNSDHKTQIRVRVRVGSITQNRTINTKWSGSGPGPGSGSWSGSSLGSGPGPELMSGPGLGSGLWPGLGSGLWPGLGSGVRGQGQGQGYGQG